MNLQALLTLSVVAAVCPWQVTSTAEAAAHAELDETLKNVGELGDSVKFSSGDRRRPRDSADAVSLFPFVAVLLAVIRAMDHSFVDRKLAAVLEWVAPYKPVTYPSYTAPIGLNGNEDLGTMCHVDHVETILSPDTSPSMMAEISTSKEPMPRIDEEHDDEAERHASSITMSACSTECETEALRSCHKDWLGSACQMDSATVVIPTPDGCLTQCRDHILFSKQVGVSGLLVFINNDGEGDGEEILDLIQAETRDILKTYGFLGKTLPSFKGSPLQAVKDLYLSKEDEGDWRNFMIPNSVPGYLSVCDVTEKIEPVGSSDTDEAAISCELIASTPTKEGIRFAMSDEGKQIGQGIMSLRLTSAWPPHSAGKYLNPWWKGQLWSQTEGELAQTLLVDCVQV